MNTRKEMRAMPKKPEKSVSKPKTGTASEISYDPETRETKFTLKPRPTKKGRVTSQYTYKDDD